MNVANIFTKTGMGNIAVKTIGAAALAAVAYDSHVAAKIESSSSQKVHKANGTTEAYMDTLSQDNPSIIQSKLKKAFFRFHIDQNISEFFVGILGYGKGFASMLMHNAIPLALATGTVLAPKGALSKTFGAGLLIYGGAYLARNVMGIGKPKHLHDF